jgi:hypothetical protein
LPGRVFVPDYERRVLFGLVVAPETEAGTRAEHRVRDDNPASETYAHERHYPRLSKVK